MMLALTTTGAVWAQALQIGTLRVDSVPSAATVELIGGRVGVTPLTVSERDIYPNTYPDSLADLYGTVTLRHPGCKPLRHRVTLTDFKRDLHLRLDCAAAPVTAAAIPSASALPATAPPAATHLPPAAGAEALPQRRLRQLQTLQELLDEGLISPAEEQRVRRRILQPGAESNK